MANRVFGRAGELLENNVDHHQDPLPEPDPNEEDEEHNVLGREFARNIARNIMRWHARTAFIVTAFKVLQQMVAGPVPLADLLVKMSATYLAIIIVSLILYFAFI